MIRNGAQLFFFIRLLPTHGAYITMAPMAHTIGMLIQNIRTERKKQIEGNNRMIVSQRSIVAISKYEHN